MTNGSKTYSIIKNAVAVSAFCVLSQGAMAQKETIPDPVPSASVPVPATLALVGIGIAGLVATRRNKRK
ncbi:MAG: hypothetical protein ACI8RN_002288 [Glaciecola sp.]|jgi:hypothetical protein